MGDVLVPEPLGRSDVDGRGRQAGEVRRPSRCGGDERRADVAAALTLLAVLPGPADVDGDVARFHQAVALRDDPGHGLPVVQRRSLHDPAPATGVVLTDVPLDGATGVYLLEDWVLAVRG